MANGRPWYVRYANTLLGTGEVGPFGVPFQPSNEAEQLFLDADPLEYKQFASQAAASAWIASDAGKTALGIGAGPASAAKTIASNAASSLGIPTFTNTRDFASRAIRVVAGLALLLTGLNMLVKETTGINVSGIAGKAAKVI